MKKIKSLIAVATVLLAFAACSENPNEIVTPEPEKGTLTAIGYPNGIPSSSHWNVRRVSVQDAQEDRFKEFHKKRLSFLCFL
jgi:hypothetical protein